MLRDRDWLVWAYPRQRTMLTRYSQGRRVERVPSRRHNPHRLGIRRVLERLHPEHVDVSVFSLPCYNQHHPLPSSRNIIQLTTHSFTAPPNSPAVSFAAASPCSPPSSATCPASASPSPSTPAAEPITPPATTSATPAAGSPSARSQTEVKSVGLFLLRLTRTRRIGCRGMRGGRIGMIWMIWSMWVGMS